MWKESIRALSPNALSSILKRLDLLSSLGCDIVRFAVPDMLSATSLLQIASKTCVPLVADIHFDYKLALECLKGNIAAIRINPGNIGAREKVELVLDACKAQNIPIRIGVNSGSLPQDIAKMVTEKKFTRAKGLVMTAFRECEVFDDLNFRDYVVSMKASSVDETVEAARLFATSSDIPLHIGVTEAGPMVQGIVKSSIAFSRLLEDNIGSTFRVSLSDTPENEVLAGRAILDVCHKRRGGVNLVSCPRCGRDGFDVHGFVSKWQQKLYSMNKDITVAVMGCVVNGPGEAKYADIGITGTGNKVLIFKKGKIIRTIEAKDADNVFEEELNSL